MDSQDQKDLDSVAKALTLAASMRQADAKRTEGMVRSRTVTTGDVTPKIVGAINQDRVARQLRELAQNRLIERQQGTLLDTQRLVRDQVKATEDLVALLTREARRRSRRPIVQVKDSVRRPFDPDKARGSKGGELTFGKSLMANALANLLTPKVVAGAGAVAALAALRKRLGNVLKLLPKSGSLLGKGLAIAGTVAAGAVARKGLPALAKAGASAQPLVAKAGEAAKAAGNRLLKTPGVGKVASGTIAAARKVADVAKPVAAPLVAAATPIVSKALDAIKGVAGKATDLAAKATTSVAATAKPVAETAAKASSGGFIKGVAKRIPFISMLAAGVDVAANELGDTTSEEKRQGRWRIAGEHSGALAGGAVGAKAGAVMGSVVPGAGTAVGAIVGGVVGAIGGALGGKFLGETVADATRPSGPSHAMLAPESLKELTPAKQRAAIDQAQKPLVDAIDRNTEATKKSTDEGKQSKGFFGGLLSKIAGLFGFGGNEGSSQSTPAQQSSSGGLYGAVTGAARKVFGLGPTPRRAGGGSSPSPVNYGVVGNAEVSKLMPGFEGAVASGPSFAQTIAKGESGKRGYNAYNRGTAGQGKEHINLESMTMGEIMALQARKDSGRLFAVGKYQMIPATLKAAVETLGISKDAKFDAAMQEYLFTNYLSTGKKGRGAIDAYITGKSNNLAAAEDASAYEWAIVQGADGRGKYDGDKAGNHARIDVGPALENARRLYSLWIAAGKKPSEALAAAKHGLAPSNAVAAQDKQLPVVAPAPTQASEKPVEESSPMITPTAGAAAPEVDLTPKPRKGKAQAASTTVSTRDMKPQAQPQVTAKKDDKESQLVSSVKELTGTVGELVTALRKGEGKAPEASRQPPTLDNTPVQIVDNGLMLMNSGVL